jgi:arsenate reductase
MSERSYNVLFLCTGNSARSVMAEAILNEVGKGRFRAYSAGSHPTGKVNPFTIELLRINQHPVADLRSKAWEEFSAPDAPQMDLVITVCDQAAGEMCPIWPGHPITAHWGFEDPAAAKGADDEKRSRFRDVYLQIMARMRLLVNLPLASLERLAGEQRVRDIGKSPS